MSGDRAARNAAVASFYDLMGAFLREVYGENIHYGYWDEGVATMSDAQDRLSDLLTGQLGPLPGRRVIDIGCGTGGLALRVARQGAEVAGVTLSRWQVDHARETAAAAGLADRARFEVADAAELPFPDDAFDAAVIVEVLVHVEDKARVLREVRRVLRPGGQLVFAELVQRHEMDPEQRAAWSAMPMSEVLTLDDYRELLAAEQFDVREAADRIDRVRRSFAETRRAVEDRAAALAGRYPPRVLDRLRRGVLALQDVTEACLGYAVVSARAIAPAHLPPIR